MNRLITQVIVGSTKVIFNIWNLYEMRLHVSLTGAQSRGSNKWINCSKTHKTDIYLLIWYFYFGISDYVKCNSNFYVPLFIYIIFLLTNHSLLTKYNSNSDVSLLIYIIFFLTDHSFLQKYLSLNLLTNFYSISIEFSEELYFNFDL